MGRHLRRSESIQASLLAAKTAVDAPAAAAVLVVVASVAALPSLKRRRAPRTPPSSPEARAAAPDVAAVAAAAVFVPPRPPCSKKEIHFCKLLRRIKSLFISSTQDHVLPPPLLLPPRELSCPVGAVSLHSLWPPPQAFLLSSPPGSSPA